ncbi:MAG: redox-regulated ATPase YchF [Clostridiales bacterium]|jgi:GTP-binding protein YchF|nr:redox-regulated ATPase YchF [Clostridiales bacterium]
MKLGIVGLPNVGKSTIFNALTRSAADAANYMYSTVTPNTGIVSVPDERLYGLDKIYSAKKITHATIEFVDIAGLARGASKGEGLGNRFLSFIREVDALVHVVRCFEDENIMHVDGSVNPTRDMETLDLELIFADMETVEKRLAKAVKPSKADKVIQGEVELLTKFKAQLDEGLPIKSLTLTEDERKLSRSFNLLSDKPVIYAANISEDDLQDDGCNNPHVQKVMEWAKNEGTEAFAICAKIEEEIAQFDDDERLAFLSDLGVSAGGLEKLITASYSLLGLISFLTAGPKEVRAWTIVNGTKAPQAGGKIHSDIERGFIRAEIVNYDDLTRLGNYNLAKEAGLVRLEGKEYVMQNGDVVLFRFNV